MEGGVCRSRWGASQTRTKDLNAYLPSMHLSIVPAAAEQMLGAPQIHLTLKG
jgi:hypothetical protein